MLGFQDRTPTAMERARVEMLKKQKSQVLLMKTASEVCARCHKPANPHTMSQFNTDIICMACKEKERLHPKYREAADAEHVAIRGGDYNFKGIGAPADL